MDIRNWIKYTMIWASLWFTTFTVAEYAFDFGWSTVDNLVVAFITGALIAFGSDRKSLLLGAEESQE